MVLNYIFVAFFLIAFVIALVKLVFLGDFDVFPAMMNSTFDTSKTAFEITFECVNTVIYGHNINNGSMFSNLVKYKDKDFALKNNTILIYLPSGDIKEYNIFSFSEIDSNSSSIYSTDITNSSRYYNNIINFSKYNLLENKDRVDNLEFLTLSTCTNQNKEKRYVIHAYKTK